MGRWAAVPVVLVLLAGCTGEAGPRPAPTASISDPASSPTVSPPTTPAPSTAPPPPPVDPAAVDVGTARATVRHLAGRIGPRPGTSPAYHRAADWVEGRLGALGWQVGRQRFRTPAGVSWGVPVPAGRSVNLVASRGDVRPGEPWLAVGAHLDTVPQSPGAEDNASGVGALLAVAEALAGRRTRLPVVLLVLGSEEPRGPTDDDHHYGSRAYVTGLGAGERAALRGMVSLDRVGVGDVLPVGSATDGDRVQRQLLRAARRAGVPTVAETGQRSSDHWSFVRAGLPAARLGSTPYAGYHSPGDRPGVVSDAQLRRTARTVLAWLR